MLVPTIRVIALLLLVGSAQIAATRLWAPLGLFDGLMVAAGLLALRQRFMPAVLTGAAAGLIQDSLAGGLIGLHAFAKTAVNAVLASLGKFLVVRGELASALVLGFAAALESLIVRLLLGFVSWPGGEPASWILGRGGATAFLCAAFLLGTPRVVMGWKRRRQRSSLRLR